MISPAPIDAIIRRRRYFSSALKTSYQTPLNIVRGAGAYLYDAQGREYLDCVNNVAHVGHCQAQVVEAMRRQVGQINTNTRYLDENRLVYAERLLAKFPKPLDVLFLVCSGSEANDLALRLIHAYTRRRGIVVVEGAYHGHLCSTLELSPYKYDGPGGAGGSEHVFAVPMPDTYRGRHRHPEPSLGMTYAGYVERGIEVLAQKSHAVAGMFCESLLSCGGQIVLPAGYLQAAFSSVRQAGGLCVADEVQVGFGRVGSHFWGFEGQGVVPDIVTLGKPIGNGYPMAAVVTTREIASAFENGMEYFNTFGGNSVACATGLAVLDVLERDRLQQHAHTVGAQLLISLRELQKRFFCIGDVRGMGLFLGIELVADNDARTPAPDLAHTVVEYLCQHGVLMSADGPMGNVLKFKPPMVFSTADAERFVSTLERALRQVS
ncbi:MAG: aminotransferase class III-fold pyridoxal phosphate-dependent enzyme [Myxococcota bacterium]